ncbi:glycosyltransferase family 39 protein [Nitrobacter sp. TKz-YC02]|uniref:glycosyltransferase family 39 protein n=1 Tax=Nitrobacter sp. TKz-YC02 TaxID=3398704 RepID=UPI003CE81897
MRFTSLVVELIRARPLLVFWIVVLFQAAMWLLVSLLLYRGPPGDLATVLAFGREYLVGTDLGPPLAFWLADIAYRAAGNHIFGVYLLSQLCFIVAFRVLFELARTIVGSQQAVLAVLLTLTVTAYGAPGLTFGPSVLALPLWSLLLLHGWRIVGQGRNAWFALSIEAGLLLLTTPAAAGLLLALTLFALATGRGRNALGSVDPLFALLVIAVLALPYLIWLVRADALGAPPWPNIFELHLRLLRWSELLLALVFATAGLLLLIVLNSSFVNRKPEDAPVIVRPPVDPLAQTFVYAFALAPALGGSLVAALFGVDHVIGGAPIALSMSGLAVVLLSGDLIHLRRLRVLRVAWLATVVAPALAVIATVIVQPWFANTEVATSIPASAISAFFGENFERRTNRPLPAVAGDPLLAALVALGPSRPHLLLDASPERTPWITPAKFNELGGVVVWRASDTAGTPPEAIAKRFPGIVPEIPRTFGRLVNGRLPLLRIGWAIVRPKAL